MHTFDFDGTDLDDAYSILASLIIPRPIALVSTVDAQGRINVAPFSFFNLLGVEPPIVALGIGDRSDGTPKDTARNILETKEFVVNLVHPSLAPAMNRCSVSLPYGQSELELAGITPTASQRVKPPRIYEAKVALECTFAEVVTIGQNRILLGQVHLCHVDESLTKTTHTRGAKLLQLATEAWAPIGRLGSPNFYCHTANRFEMQRPD